MTASLMPPANGAARKTKVSREDFEGIDFLSPDRGFRSPTPDVAVSAAPPLTASTPDCTRVAEANKAGFLDSPFELGKLSIIVGLGLSYREAEPWVKFDDTTIGRAVRRNSELAEEIRVYSQLARLYPILRIHITSRRSWRAAAWLCGYLKKLKGGVDQADLLATLVWHIHQLRVRLFTEEVLVDDSNSTLPVGEARSSGRQDRAVPSGDKELRPPPPLMLGAPVPGENGRPSTITPHQHGQLLATLACGLTQREAAIWCKCRQSSISYLVSDIEFRRELIHHTELARLHPYLRLFQSCSSSWKAAAELLVYLEQRHGKFTAQDLLAALDLLAEKGA